MSAGKSRSIPFKYFTALAILAAVLFTVFLAGRYGWKLGGFRFCGNAGIRSVEVNDNSVRLTGFYPGSFPEGFCGCYAEERDGKLYVGFRFSAVFGFFETGDFDVTIPVKGEIDEIIVKTRTAQRSLWSAEGETVLEDDSDSVSAPWETPTVLEAYASVIGAYDTALDGSWDAAQMMEAGLNYMVADSFFNAPMEDIGYAVMDLDGDGREELVIGSRLEDVFLES